MSDSLPRSAKFCLRSSLSFLTAFCPAGLRTIMEGIFFLCWLMLAHLGPMLAYVGPSWLYVGLCWLILVQLGSNLAQLGSNLAQLGPNLAQLGPNLAQLGSTWPQHRPNIAQLSSNMGFWRPTWHLKSIKIDEHLVYLKISKTRISRGVFVKNQCFMV